MHFGLALARGAAKASGRVWKPLCYDDVPLEARHEIRIDLVHYREHAARKRNSDGASSRVQDELAPEFRRFH